MGFLGSKIPLYDTVMGDTGHRAFVKTPRMHHAKSERSCKVCTLVNISVSSLLAHLL